MLFITALEIKLGWGQTNSSRKISPYSQFIYYLTLIFGGKKKNVSACKKDLNCITVNMCLISVCSLEEVSSLTLTCPRLFHELMLTPYKDIVSNKRSNSLWQRIASMFYELDIVLIALWDLISPSKTTLVSKHSFEFTNVGHCGRDMKQLTSGMQQSQDASSVTHAFNCWTHYLPLAHVLPSKHSYFALTDSFSSH